jgi:hypothetical protein
MRRVLLASVLLISVIAPTGRAAMAKPDPASITVTGSRTSYVDVRFDEKFRLDPWSAGIEFKGRFAGWMIHPLGEPLEYDKDDYIGSYMFRDVGPGDPEYGDQLFTITLAERTFSPGRYRVYLFADGAAKISVPLTEGTRSKTIRPVKGTTARLAVNDIPMAAPKVVNDSISQPLRVSSNSLTLSSAYLFAQEGATVQAVGACLREEAEPSPDQQNCEGGGVTGYLVHPQQDYVFILTSVYPPGTVKSAEYYSYASARATAVDRAVGVGLTIDLP